MEHTTTPVGGSVTLSPSEIIINRAIDKVVAWIDRWIVTPYFGVGGDASDY
jgi:hypothetical protein